MIFSNITIIDENFEPQKNMYVGVKDGRIAYISDKAPENVKDFGEVYDGSGKLLCPAFVNAHSHLPMALLRGYGENLPLMNWLNDEIFPFEAKLTEEDIYYGTLMGIAESLRYGIGSVSEMYIRQLPLAKAFLESGMKANFCVSTVCFDGSHFKDTIFYKDALACKNEYDGSGNGRLKSELCLHAEYTNPEHIVREIAEVAADWEQGIQVHVSESRSEVAECRNRHDGRSPVKYLHDCGLFNTPATAAHCVHIDDEDIAILKEDGVSVATCPKSNLKLASGICPVSKLLDAGVNVAIGTDSVASNNNLNMLEEMRFFALLQKGISYDPVVISPKETLYAATRAGAVAQQRSDCGLIKEGFKADLTVFDMSGFDFTPGYNALYDLVYSAAGTDVVLTMVDGKVLYKDGVYTTIDIERIKYEIKRISDRIITELK